MIIDFHTHTFPDNIAAFAIPKMQQSCHAKAYTDGTCAGLQNSMKEAGIDLSVVLPVATNPLKVSHINDLSIQLTDKDHLIYFACMHPDAPNALEELSRVARAGLKGIKIHPVYQDVNIDDIRFLRILDKCAALGLSVVMHAGDDIGFPDVVRCSPEMIANALRQVGDVNLICAHMGGWRNWDTVEILSQFKNVYLDTAFSLGHIEPIDDYYNGKSLSLLSREDFCRLVNTFGSKRVLFGTDSPWADQRATLEAVKEAGLTKQQLQSILSDNAKKLLGI